MIAKYVERLARLAGQPIEMHLCVHASRGHRRHPGRPMVVVVDDEDRENEGDLTIAAEKVTPERDQLHGPARRAASSACR